MSNHPIQPAASVRLSIKAQTLATLAAIAAAVALPQCFHVLGTITGLGTALGETFLPMHLPVLLVGLLAGPYAGAAAGLFSPLVSFALSGMPGAAMLPFMMMELFVYGLTTGLLSRVRMPVLVKVVIAQVAGRAVRAGAILTACYVLGSWKVAPAVIWTSIVSGLFGLILQWVLLPLIIFRAEHAGRDDG